MIILIHCYFDSNLTFTNIVFETGMLIMLLRFVGDCRAYDYIELVVIVLHRIGRIGSESVIHYIARLLFLRVLVRAELMREI